MNKKKIIALILGIVVIAGTIALIYKPNKEEVKKEREYTVKVDDITVGIDGDGKAELQGTDHYFQINGMVEEIYVKKGQKVKEGDKIAKLSGEKINLELEELKIDKNIKSDTLSKLKEQKKAMPDDKSPEYKTLDLEVKTAQGELDKVNGKINKLNKDLGKLEVYAKNSGVVLDIGYELKAEATTLKPIAIVGDEKSVFVEVAVPQTDIININEGQEVKVRFETYPDTEIKGSIESKSFVSTVQGEETSYKVKAKLDIGDKEIYQGMTGEVKFITKNKEDVLQVPNKAITMKDNKQIVKVKGENGNTEVEVKTGFSDGRVTEILEGLQAGDIVIEER